MILRISFLFLFISHTLFVQAQNQSSDLEYASTKGRSFGLASPKPTYNHSTQFSAIQFNKDIEAGTRKHPLVKTGKILTFIGLPLLVIGTIMVSNSDALYYQCYNGVCEGDPRGGFGVLILASGAGLSGTGIILWTIGKNKSR